MRQILLIVSLLLIASCGFEPVYGTMGSKNTTVEAGLEQVDIAIIPDREGQYLRNALIDRFYRYTRPQNPKYNLVVAPVTERLIDLDITKDSDATRGQLRLTTSLRLVNIETQETVLTRGLQSISSYNILGSEFATRVTEENARQNTLDDLARQIELQIGLYLKRSH